MKINKNLMENFAYFFVYLIKNLFFFYKNEKISFGLHRTFKKKNDKHIFKQIIFFHPLTFNY